jgi:hypothetical protein
VFVFTIVLGSPALDIMTLGKRTNGCRSLVDRYASLGSCKPTDLLFNLITRSAEPRIINEIYFLPLFFINRAWNRHSTVVSFKLDISWKKKAREAKTDMEVWDTSKHCENEYD